MMGHSIEPIAPGKHTHESLSSLIAELRRENIRLQLLVSELLLRNQELRTRPRTN
jgi:hypothetical protein